MYVNILPCKKVFLVPPPIDLGTVILVCVAVLARIIIGNVFVLRIQKSTNLASL